jgi:hypothetical protein
MDLCYLAGHHYLVYVDRYSGWIEIAKMNTTTTRDIRRELLFWFTLFGVPMEIATDGGPPFNSMEYAQFIKDLDIRTRLSSAYYPQSNGRAEAAVKSAKRILFGNICPVTGRLDTYKATKALMTHRNTPTQDTGISPAEILFGRPIRDHLPYGQTQREWQRIADSREVALAKRHVVNNTAVTDLEPLNVGDAVQIQNQTGNQPKKWHNTGIISEVLPHRQYRVVVDGSRRITLRNRRFLRKIHPFCRHIERNAQHVPSVSYVTPPTKPPTTEPQTHQPPTPSTPTTDTDDKVQTPTLRAETPPPPEPISPTQLRRSTRDRRPPMTLSPSMKGKSHELIAKQTILK